MQSERLMVGLFFVETMDINIVQKKINNRQKDKKQVCERR